MSVTQTQQLTPPFDSVTTLDPLLESVSQPGWDFPFAFAEASDSDKGHTSQPEIGEFPYCEGRIRSYSYFPGTK